MEYKCIEVGHHKDIGDAIAEWQEKGWRLHTYAAAGNPGAISHYLLLEKGS